MKSDDELMLNLCTNNNAIACSLQATLCKLRTNSGTHAHECLYSKFAFTIMSADTEK